MLSKIHLLLFFTFILGARLAMGSELADHIGIVEENLINSQISLESGPEGAAQSSRDWLSDILAPSKIPDQTISCKFQFKESNSYDATAFDYDIDGIPLSARQTVGVLAFCISNQDVSGKSESELEEILTDIASEYFLEFDNAFVFEGSYDSHKLFVLATPRAGKTHWRDLLVCSVKDNSVYFATIKIVSMEKQTNPWNAPEGNADWFGFYNWHKKSEHP